MTAALLYKIREREKNAASSERLLDKCQCLLRSRRRVLLSSKQLISITMRYRSSSHHTWMNRLRLRLLLIPPSPEFIHSVSPRSKIQTDRILFSFSFFFFISNHEMRKTTRVSNTLIDQRGGRWRERERKKKVPLYGPITVVLADDDTTSAQRRLI